MKGYSFVLLLFLSVGAFAQNSINNYKYVLLPERFSFSKEVNEYGLNTVAKSLLEEKGFTVYFNNTEIPKELAGNKCNALLADVEQRKAIFTTNLTLILKDCQGNVLFKGKEGKSREKDFYASYNGALREAFKSLDDAHYAYNGTTNNAPAATPAPAQPQASAPVAAPPSPVPASQPATVESKEAAGTLYAQATANGYQLIDTSPKIVLTLSKTSTPDLFIAENSTAHGVVSKKNGDWYFEYYKDGKLVAEKLLIKF